MLYIAPSLDSILISISSQFENPLVEQALIIARAIERCALVPLRADGDELLRTKPRNVLEAYSSDLFKVGFL